MKKSKFNEKGLAEYIIEARGYKKSFLDYINEVFNWKKIEKMINKKYKKTENTVGCPAYPALNMFKILLLQIWYNLSDPAMEEALYDRISFLRFTGFSMTSNLPDHSTICRFRNELLKLGLYDELLKEINRQLVKKGLILRTGAIVDASVVESSRRPRKVVEVMAEDRKEEETIEEENNDSCKVTYSDDPDARWLKKGKKCYYGYKAHIAADADKGYILGGHMTSANVSDMNQLENIIDESELDEGTIIFGDKGYCSSANRKLVIEKGMRPYIMRKARRNNPLHSIEKWFNKLISKTRYKVEQCFGTLKRKYGFNRLRYVGIEKAQMELCLNAMAFNMKKAVRAIT